MPLTKIQTGLYEDNSIQSNDLAANVTAPFATTAALSNYATTNSLSSYATTAALSNYATTTALTEFATTLAPKVSSVAIADNTFTVLDDTAVALDGGYIVITGVNFAVGVTVLIDTTSALSVARVSSTTLRVQVPAKAAASYNIFVVNPDGGTGIRVAGITYSANPNWVTTSPLQSQQANVAFAVRLNATGANTYSIAAGSALPAGTTLLANGYFYGTSTVGVHTNFSFNVVATDIELQDSPKTFALTVSVIVRAKLFAFGRSTFGFSGQNYGPEITYQSPVQVGALTDWSVDAAINGATDLAVVKNDGTLWVCGKNDWGRFGMNDIIARSSPIQVGALTDWASVAFDSNSTFATKKNGTLWAIGGLALTLDYSSPAGVFKSSPIQIGTISTWKKIYTSGGYQMLAIRTDGTLWGWGEGNYGNLGIPDKAQKSSPVQIGTDTWSSISLDGSLAMGIKTNGTLWGWGSTNNVGQLGLNDTISRSSPVQVGALTNWSTVSVNPLTTNATGTTVAVKTDGTLWSWGGNGYGGLGIGDSTASLRRSSPVQVGSLTNWKNASAGRYQSYAVKQDGTLWGWGGNTYGTLGVGNTNTAYSPIQIGSQTNWDRIITTKTNNSTAAIGLTKEV